MKLFGGRKTGLGDRQRRLVWQAVSLLLAYPDRTAAGLVYDERLALVARAVDELPPVAADPLGRAVADLSGIGAYEASKRYVDTFDLRRRRALLLTYWTDGDTRNRGHAMLQFVAAYREAGVEPPDGEVPDHLAVVLEFGATVDTKAGLALLARYRAPLELLRRALADYESPYAGAVEAVLATVPEADDAETEREVRRIAGEGPPQESVGLDPYSVTVPVESLTASLHATGGAG